MVYNIHKYMHFQRERAQRSLLSQVDGNKNKRRLLSMSKRLDRGAGILLPISSLPSPYGIGTLGKTAYKFVDKLGKAGQKYWQDRKSVV